MTHDSVIPASRTDRDWWLALVPTLEWTWATTYSDSAPHWYVVRGRTPGLAYGDYVRVGRVIRTFGEPGKFWNSTNLYLFTADRAHKFWCMWSSPPQPEADPFVINMTTADQVYGPQRGFNRARLTELGLPEQNPTLF